jgi:hypothetical protein
MGVGDVLKCEITGDEYIVNSAEIVEKDGGTILEIEIVKE